MPFLGTEISRGGGGRGGGMVNIALFKASEEINMSARYCMRRVSFPLRKQEHYNTYKMESLLQLCYRNDKAQPIS